MSETVFTKVDYDLGTLIKFIALGQIGLPHIQRPFVWKNAKVRDLFDSMYKGYPVGYLLLWRNGLTDGGRKIGAEAKQKAPDLVIVDGQQRLTSLYAVIRNIPVLRSTFKTEHIQIAFNPLQETFEVADAAIKRDPAFVPDISVLWRDDVNIFQVINGYMEGLRTTHEITDQQEATIQNRILAVQGMLAYPLTALELKPDIEEEAVSNVFVRINSTGTRLSQADFILTLMSVFWDEGRAALERFCRDSLKPAKGRVSPYNYLIEPSPDELLRVAVGVAFKRARLRYVYSILRGKDLETGDFSEERREQQFDRLKDAQQRVLNLQYWHDFLGCIHRAGFRSSKMISSKNNLLFSYVLYLIGRTEYKVPEHALRGMIARWFFMSAVTGRFTGSPESAMEFDLARLRDVTTSQGFLKTLSQICDIALTSDFWAVALPNDLATSSSRSPSLYAYHAALVLLDARALFSDVRVADLLDPAVNPPRSVERHHLFPKGFLAKLGITAVRDTNQIANYALVEWADNMTIADQAPSDYFPEMRSQVSQASLEKMYRWHALPPNWEKMEYRDFLEKRRELMARAIADGYATLVAADAEEDLPPDVLALSRVAASGESEAIEFKSTLRTNLHTGSKDARIELAVLKTLAAFLNTRGGTLVIGVSDDGSPVGVEADGFENDDKMSLHLVNIVGSRVGASVMARLQVHFGDYDDARVMIVKCQESPVPVFVKDGNTERFFIRTGPATTELTPSQTVEYIKQRFR
jgi:hypothetical protein